MADIGMRGSNASQDTRFKDKEAGAIKATKFPKSFSEKVDLRKVNLSVLRSWIATKVTELIKIEDDVVVEYVYGMLEDKANPTPDPRKMQVNLVGFMDKHGAAAFMEQLWGLLLSAQATVGGVPAEFIAAKKAELEEKQLNDRRQQDSMRPGQNQGYQNRPQASDSFPQNRDRGYNLPNRLPDTLPRRRSPPPQSDFRRAPPPQRRFDDRERDRGYQDRSGRDSYAPNGRGPGGPGGGGGRYRSRSPPPARYRRRSPSPSTRRRSPSPNTRRSPPRRASPPPDRRVRERSRSITPPLRAQAQRSRSPTPPRRRRDSGSPRPGRGEREERGRSRSRTPTPSDPGARVKRPISRSRSRSRSRSPTVTPPRRRRRSSTPPVRRQRDDTPPRRGARLPSPGIKRRRSPSGDRERERDVIKKGRGRFSDSHEEERAGKAKLEGALAKSKWA